MKKPIDRLLYSCEIGDGIDQHAAPDLLLVKDELEALRKVAEAAEESCGRADVDAELRLLDALKEAKAYLK